MVLYGIEWDPSERRLLIESFKASFKAVLLHIDNAFLSPPLGTLFDGLWTLQDTNHIVGQQAVYTKDPCFLCLWDSRTRHFHWTESDWPIECTLNTGEKFINSSEEIFISLLHIRLGIMKLFIKSLPKDGECFRYLCSKLSKLSEVNIIFFTISIQPVHSLIPSCSLPDVLCDPTDLIWRKWTPFEAMTGRTAPSSDGLLAEVFWGFPRL